MCSKIRPILALNCLLQIEQQRSEQDSFVGDALALALCCARFCLASLILFASYSLAPLLMRPRHFAWSCAICSHDCWYVAILEGGFEGVFVSPLLTTIGAFANDGNNSINIQDFNVILLKWEITLTRIPRIGCVACLKRQPFGMKKEKKILVPIIAPIPKGDQVDKGP